MTGSKTNRWEVVCSKIHNSTQQLEKTLNYWRLKDQKIVFTNGCFDILHRGHVRYLAETASLGNRLIIGLNSDESVRKLKGVHRPIQDEESRAMILASLHVVDAVIIFGEDTPEQLIKIVNPDFLVKGGDWAIESIAGAGFVQSQGGQVLSIPFTYGFSTTQIEQKIKAS
jgi:D-glycero-beta-D-manno-heptose 1-phosphate adenylyltransferase